MPDNDDKGKIIDLWKRSRQKIKESRQRNLIRRFILIAFFLVINGGLLSFSFFLGSPDLANSISISRMPISEPINLLEKQKKNSINAAFRNSIGEQRHFWLMGLDLNKIIKQIRSQNPLINKIEIKPIIWDGSFTLPKPQLIVNYAEETPWARSNAGWLLTASGRIIQDTHDLNLDNLSLASNALLDTDNSEYDFWSNKGKQIKNLIYSINQQLPEIPLQKVVLKKDEPIIVLLGHTTNKVSGNSINTNEYIEISLGNWDEQILDRASKIASISSYIRQYEKQIAEVDMSTGVKAIIKLSSKNKIEKFNETLPPENTSLEASTNDIKNSSQIPSKELISKQYSEKLQTSQSKKETTKQNSRQNLSLNNKSTQENKSLKIKEESKNEVIKSKSTKNSNEIIEIILPVTNIKPPITPDKKDSNQLNSDKQSLSNSSPNNLNQNIQSLELEKSENANPKSLENPNMENVNTKSKVESN